MAYNDPASLPWILRTKNTFPKDPWINIITFYILLLLFKISNLSEHSQKFKLSCVCFFTPGSGYILYFYLSHVFLVLSILNLHLTSAARVVPIGVHLSQQFQIFIYSNLLKSPLHCWLSSWPVWRGQLSGPGAWWWCCVQQGELKLSFLKFKNQEPDFRHISIL